MGNAFTKRYNKYDKKDRFFKRIKNIEDKYEEQLQLFSKVNKTHRLVKNEIIITTIYLLFGSFTETFKTLKKGHWSLNKTT